jgi:hypothetical protein
MQIDMQESGTGSEANWHGLTKFFEIVCISHPNPTIIETFRSA